jgi:fatty acid desaturase
MDVYPVLAAVVHFGLFLVGILGFSILPWWALVGIGLVVAYLHLTNVNSFGHHFIHTPFFRWEWMNRLFSLMNTFCLGTPQEMYRVVHLRHHAFNNDFPTVPGGMTRDWHSIYRYGRDGAAENVFAYAIMTHLRMDLVEIFVVLYKQGRHWRTVAECIGWFLMVLACAWVNWQGVVFFYLPIVVLAWPVSYAQNYYEHLGAVPGNRHADAVSSYGRLYNYLWFNNGYHQEHHYQPSAHWTEMEAVRKKHGQSFRDNGLRVLRRPHLFAFLEPPPATPAPPVAGSGADAAPAEPPPLVETPESTEHA